MALVIDLKPHEKILVGNAVITNDKQRTRLHIAGDSPILREKDIMKEEDAHTPCEKIYYMIQMMYLAENPQPLHDPYFKLLGEIQDSAPSTALFFMRINDNIIDGSYYKALKEAKKLIEHEQELLEHAE